MHRGPRSPGCGRDAGRGGRQCGSGGRPGNEQEAQRTHAPDPVHVGAFAGAGFGRRQGVHLKAADGSWAGTLSCCQAQLAPVPRGDDVEGELALEFRDRLRCTGQTDRGRGSWRRCRTRSAHGRHTSACRSKPRDAPAEARASPRKESIAPERACKPGSRPRPKTSVLARR